MAVVDDYLNSIAQPGVPQNDASRRADRMQRNAAIQTSGASVVDSYLGGAMGGMPSDGLSSPPAASARPAAIPSEKKKYSAGEFAEDLTRKAGGSLVGGTLRIPEGAETGIKGVVRRSITGESPLVPQAQWAEKAASWLMDATGFRSYAEQQADREKAVIAFDRMMSGVNIPGVRGLAEYGDRVQQDIESGISDAGKERLAGSTPKGNILKGELSFGDDPTVSGYALQAAGVLGSLAPTVATALITRSPTAAMAVGGTQAAGEASSTARDYIGNLDDRQLREVSPYYNTLLNNGVPEAEARQIVTDKAAETGAMLQGMVAALGSRVTGKLLTGAYDDILRRVGGNTAGATAAGAAFSAAEEGIQETAEGIASDIGIRSQITNKEIGEDSAANLVLGAIGGAPVGAISGAKSTPQSVLSSYLDRAISGARSSPEAIDRAARAALDPNSYDPTLVDPRDNRPADSATLGEPVRQLSTAVPVQGDTPEQTAAGAQAQQMSLPADTGVAGQQQTPAGTNAVDAALGRAEADFVSQLDAQTAQATAVQQTVPESLRTAIESIKVDLQVDPNDTLNLTEVTNDTRLNRFKNALESAFGVKVHFVDFGEQLTTGSGRALGAFNGYRSGDTILVGAKGVDFLDTTWHELTHVLETRYPDVYRALRDRLVPNLDPGVREQLVQSLNAARQAEVGRDLSATELDSELVAYAVGDLVRSPQTLGQMFDSFEDPEVAKTFRDVLSDILAKLLNVIKGPQYIKERARLVEAQKAVTVAFAEYQKRETQKRMGTAAPAQQTAGAAPQAATQPAAQTGTAAQTAPIKKPVVNPFLVGTSLENDMPKSGQFERKIPTEQEVVDMLAKGETVDPELLLRYPNVNQSLMATIEVLRRAPKVKAKYDAAMKRIAKKYGVKLIPGPIKGTGRAFFKIHADYRGDATKLKDAVRSTIEFSDPSELTQLVDSILNEFPDATVKRNTWAPGSEQDQTGYRDVLFAGIQIDGMLVELQLNHPAMLAAKKKAHPLYAESETLRREIEGGTLSPEQLQAKEAARDALVRRQAREYYNPAYQEVLRANLDMNSRSEIGTPSEDMVDMPNGRGSDVLPSSTTSQATGPLPGSTVTGMPSTSTNEVPGGNDLGNDIVVPQTIPSSNIPQRNDAQKPNPLLSIVDAKEAEGRVARRLKRKAGVGAPVNERRVIRAPGLPDFIVGRITPQDWLNRVTALMSTAEMQDSRVWYRQLDEAFRPLFGDSTPKFALAWLLSQKRASPTKGFMDVLRAADMAAGNPEVKKAGLNQQALIDVLSDRVPEGGIGAKLLDFLDSELGRNTRTVVRDDPRGRQPAAIDVWAQRDIGFIDETVFEYLKKNYGEEAVAGLQIDKTTSGEAQYEYGIDFYNDVVDMLNEQGYDGGAWTAREVQAVGWVTMQRQMGIQAEFVRDIISGNTRRISIGLAPGANSALSNKLAGKEIPVEVAQREISYLADLAGVRVKQNIAGVGAYLQWIEGAIQIDGVGSPEAVADFMDMVGYAFQQTEVINTRPLKSARNMAVDVMSPGLDSVDRATAFFSKFLETGPKDKQGEPVAPGFQQITIEGVPGIRLLNFGGKWRQTQLAEMRTALYGAADALGIELADVATTNVELNSTKNDWSENSDGKNYIDSLTQRGRVRQAELLQRRYPPSRVDVAGDGSISWQQDEAAGDGTVSGTSGQFRRQLIQKAANQEPGVPDLFIISEPPTLFRSIGAPADQALVMQPRNIAKVVNPEFVGKSTGEDAVRRTAFGLVVPAAPRIPLTVDELYNIPRMIADPVAVIRQESNNAGRRFGYKVILDMVKNGYPVVAIVHPQVRYLPRGTKEGPRNPVRYVSDIASVYPVNEQASLDTINRELNGAQLLYFNKGKAVALSGKIAGKLPSLPKINPVNAKTPGTVTDRGLPQFGKGNWSRVIAPVADPDGVIRVNGREYPARTADESYTKEGTKKYMKRAIDTMPAPTELPFAPDEFFATTQNTQLIAVADIISSKSDEENKQGGSNAPKRFLAAYDGILQPRDPIAIRPNGDGTYTVIDGNGTLTAFKQYGWESIPADVYANEAEFEAAEQAKKDGPQYRAFSLTDADRRMLADRFPPAHERVILDHITASIEDTTSPAKGEVIGIADKDGLQVLAVRVNGKTRRADGTRYHISVSATQDARTRNSGQVLEGGFTAVVPPVPLNLQRGADYSAPMRGFARQLPTVGDRFTLPARSNREMYVENLFENRMSRVEDIQEAVVEQGGTLDIRDAQGNVVGTTDIASASQRMRGAVRGRLDRFKKEVEIPLIEDAAKSGVNLDEVAQYLYAVYAPERNAIIQQRNPTQFATDGGSGMTNAEAAQIVGSFRARRDFAEIKRIADRFQKITSMTQNILLSEGLVEPQVIAQWKQDNPNYVPLRGFENVDEQTGSPLGIGSPGRLDPRNPFVKTAKGRTTRAANILENILKDYSDAVVLAEKNKVNRLLLQFVRDNPDPKLWEVNAPKVSRSYMKGGMTPMGYAQGSVRVAFEVNENPSETIAVRVQGRTVFIRVKDEGMLDDMQMAGAIGSGDQAKLYFRVWSGTMQTLAKLRTTLSPAFVFIDALRNTETGGFWNLVKYGPKTAYKAYARLFKAARVAWKAERDGTWQGNSDTITIRPPGQAPQTITLKEAYDMYRADGGKVGYLDIKEIEDIQKDIQDRFRAAQVSGSLDPRTYGTQMLDVVNKVEDVMLDAAGSVESAMRFATYMARLEAGATRQEATDAAKNVTVNFDRKGKWTPHLGLLYMFANANIQGTRATYNLIFKSGKAGAILGGSLVTLGYAIAQLGAGDTGDDDEPYWDKQLYKQAKIKNLLFFTEGGNTITIPMAYGAGFFVNLGYALSDLQRGVPMAKVAAFMRDSFFTHFSPFGSLENPATFAAPTLLDPIVVAATNETEQGIPLMPDSAFEPGKPDSEKFWAATRGTMFQQLSRALNEATGGTQGYSGAVDISPESLRYWVGFMTGGAGGFVRDTADSMLLTTEIGLDTAVDKNKIPILRSFYQKNTGKQNQIEFFRNSEEALRALNEWKLISGTETARRDDVATRLMEERRLAILGGAVDSYKRALSSLRAEEVQIIDRRTAGAYTAADAEQRLARIAEKKNRLYVDFNREFYRRNPSTPE